MNFAVMKVAYRSFLPIAFNACRFVIASITVAVLMKSSPNPVRFERKDLQTRQYLQVHPGMNCAGFYEAAAERTSGQVRCCPVREEPPATDQDFSGLMIDHENFIDAIPRSDLYLGKIWQRMEMNGVVPVMGDPCI